MHSIDISNAGPERIWKEILSLWEKLRIVDRRKLSSTMRKVKDELHRGEISHSELESFVRRLERAYSRSLFPHADSLKYEFPEELPITSKIDDIRKALSENQVVIICGATGSGKTTQLPKAALMQGFGRKGRIGCTQPRRIAASALAQRLASECGCPCGEQVGYKVRFDDQTSDSTVIKFMTDGILLAETRDDPSLFQYDCIILDEVHERSLNIDFLLGYMKLLVSRRKDLRVVISSATLESGRISEFFDNAPIIEVEGRLFPIEDCFLEGEEDEDLSDAVARGVEFLSDLDSRGDILVFLPGEREIRDASELLTGRRLPNTEILPLYGRLSGGEQNRIFKPGGQRRIILSTNVAETSLTIPGIRFVIDSGLVRLSRYNPKSRIQELRIEFISQASARQRRGRCGRLRDGVCVHLYSQEALEQAPPYTDPEIQRSSLAGVILQMASLRLPQIEKFPFVDPPTPAHIREGLRTLDDLQAIDQSQNLTQTGRELAGIPLDPHLGKILLESLHYHIPSELIIICSFLSIQDPRERPFEQAKAADDAQKKFNSDQSDFISILNLWEAVNREFKEKQSHQAVRRFAKKHFLNYRRLREWRNLAEDLSEMLDSRTKLSDLNIDTEHLNYDAIHKSLLGGMPRQMAFYLQEERMYHDMTGKKFLLFPGSGLAKQKKTPRYILFFTLMETTRVFARCNAEVRPEWLEETAPRLCRKSYDQIAWDEKSGFVYAREKVTAGQLLIHPGRRRHYGKINPEEARRIFIQDALLPGHAHLNGTWLDRYSAMITRLYNLELRSRNIDSIVDKNALMKHFERVLPMEICSIESLKNDWRKHKKDYTPPPEDIMHIRPGELSPDDFPDCIRSSGETLNLKYVFDPGEKNDGVTALVPEESLNLVDRHFPEYLVPGYLKWKIDYLIRSFPKAIRKQLMPMSECAARFMTDYKNGKVFTEQPFADAFADFLNENYDAGVQPEDILSIELPEYLKMKIGIVNRHGKIEKTIMEFPAEDKITSKLSPVLKVSKKWHLKGCQSWPGTEEMPYSIEISKENQKKAYPALVDETESVGRTLYLKESEAVNSHEQGILRLYKIEFPQILKQLRGTLKLPHRAELSFFLKYPRWKDDFLDDAIRKSFPEKLRDIRSAEKYESYLEASRDSIAAIAEEQKEILLNVSDAYAPVEKLLEKIPEDSFTFEDVSAQLNFFFREGFLLFFEAVEQYPRYLRSLRVRLERAIASSLQKDESKADDIMPFIEKFRLLADTTPGWEQSSSLREYFLLLQEARIAAFTPELKSPVKCSAKVLQNEWDSLEF